MSLFESVLGKSFNELPPLLQRLHDGCAQRWQGRAIVTWGKPWWVKAMLTLAGLPRPGECIPCRVDFQPTRRGERIRRNFAGQRFHSHLRKRGTAMVESFGPMRLCLSSTVRGGQLLQSCTSTRVLGIPLPQSLGLHILAREWCSEAGMHFDVSVGLAGTALLRYQGQLLPMENVGNAHLRSPPLH